MQAKFEYDSIRKLYEAALELGKLIPGDLYAEEIYKHVDAALNQAEECGYIIYVDDEDNN